MPSRFRDQRLKTGDVLRVERPGGGEVGAALDRSPEDVVEDVRQGYVSVERARNDYAVLVRSKSDEVSLDADSKFAPCHVVSDLVQHSYSWKER